MKLLSQGKASPKLIKSDEAGLGYLSTILYLIPHSISGHNICPSSSNGCRNHCLNYSGRGYMSNVIAGRMRKTKLFFDDRQSFFKILHKDISAFSDKVEKLGLKPAVRLNGLSDLPWEKLDPSLFTKYPHIQFYDYTKIYSRMMKYLSGDFPSNYHLTFSRHEDNHEKCLDVLKNKGNVAVVFPTKELPKTFKRYKVYNGDLHDLRFLDKFGVCGLYAKGKAKKDVSGFVYR